MSKFIKTIGTALAITLLFSCDKEWDAFAYYYPRKHYPGRGEAIIQGDKLSGRFGYQVGKDDLLYITCVIPKVGKASEWTLYFAGVPAQEGTYGLIQTVLKSESTCYSGSLSEKVGALVTDAAGDALGDFYYPYCKEASLPSQIKITKISKGDVYGEFSVYGVNSTDSTEFIKIEKGIFSSPKSRM